MNFVVIKRSHVKRNILIGVVVVLVLSAIILTFTRAKYRVTQSIPLVNGTINYSPGDIIISAYFNGELLEKFPAKEDGYIVENVTCDKEASATFNEDAWEIEVTNLVTKGTKCNVIFVENAKKYILSHYKTVLTRNDFSTSVTDTTTGTIYKSLDETQYDNDGEVYYFAGAPTDNWVKFGGFYWRIIRINGDGSVRLLYNGTSTTTIGTGTQLTNGSVFNNSDERSEYVGLKFTQGSQHGQNTDSTILTALNSWYTNSLDNYAEHIDSDIGFCSDRNMASGYSWSSQPNSDMNYAAYDRLANSYNPNLGCNSNDIIKIPVGLITADEVMFGGVPYSNGSGSAQGNYLYNEQIYWTMTPSNIYSSSATVFNVSYGYLGWESVDITRGVRPVINLRADVQLTGSGTSTDPYVVVGAS